MDEVKYYKITYRAMVKCITEIGVGMKSRKTDAISHGKNIEEAMGKVKDKFGTDFIEFLKVELVEDS